MRNPPFAVIWTELDRNTVNQAEKDKYHMIYPVHHTEEGLMAFRSEGGRRARDRHVRQTSHQRQAGLLQPLAQQCSGDDNTLHISLKI